MKNKKNKQDEELVSSFLEVFPMTSKAKNHTILFQLLQKAIVEDKTLREVMQEYDVKFVSETYSKDGDYFIQAEVERFPSPVVISDETYNRLVRTFILPVLRNEDTY